MIFNSKFPPWTKTIMLLLHSDRVPEAYRKEFSHVHWSHKPKMDSTGGWGLKNCSEAIQINKAGWTVCLCVCFRLETNKQRRKKREETELECIYKDDSSLVQLFIMLHRPVNFEISAVACTSQQANLKKQWSMKYYKQLNGKAIIFNRIVSGQEGVN